MLREKISRFLSYSGATTNIKRAIASTLSIAFASSISKKPSATVKTYDSNYDLAVIGGGSGGLATAFEANKHGLKVIVIDFVEETLHKSKWGIGGTCVNVGCIPKKLMHQAAKCHEEIINSSDYGWELDELNDRSKEEELSKRFNWVKLRSKVQGYIKSINFGYISNINKVNDMDYLNCLATFKDKNTIICSKDTKIIK
jgi:thioredoxin reductase (NADPH)